MVVAWRRCGCVHDVLRRGSGTRTTVPRAVSLIAAALIAIPATLITIPATPAFAAERSPGSTCRSGRATSTGRRWRRRRCATSSCGRRSGTRRPRLAPSIRSISSTSRGPRRTGSSWARTTVRTSGEPSTTRPVRPTSSCTTRRSRRATSCRSSTSRRPTGSRSRRCRTGCASGSSGCSRGRA